MELAVLSVRQAPTVRVPRASKKQISATSMDKESRREGIASNSDEYLEALVGPRLSVPIVRFVGEIQASGPSEKCDARQQEFFRGRDPVEVWLKPVATRRLRFASRLPRLGRVRTDYGRSMGSCRGLDRSANEYGTPSTEYGVK